jgi:hypothetical protein
VVFAGCFHRFVPPFSGILSFLVFLKNHIFVGFDTFESSVLEKGFDDIFVVDRAGKDTQNNALPVESSNPVNVVTESIFGVGFAPGEFIVANKVEIDLSKVKDEGDVFGSGLDPFLDFESFLFIGFGEALDAFAFEFDVEGVFCVEEHVDEGVTECEVVDVLEILFVDFGVVVEFGRVGAVGLWVKVGFGEGFFYGGFLSHIKEPDN